MSMKQLLKSSIEEPKAILQCTSEPRVKLQFLINTIERYYYEKNKASI